MALDIQADLEKHLKQLAAIGVALSAEKDVEKILEMIIVEAMDFADADGGTLYLTQPEDNYLTFTLVRNRTLGTTLGGKAGRIDWPPVPLEKDGKPNMTNVSAYAAITEEVVNIADVYEMENFDFSGTREYDRKNNYRSKSMLVVPMKDNEDRIIGVMQLINAMKEGEPVPFTDDQQEMMESLASQAAVALNNAGLMRDLERLFNSLVTSIGTAIDEKSPYTGGHVRRVAELTIDIAHAVNEAATGALADFRLDEAKRKELQMAAWLHDIGKVTTPESLLDKSKKLETIIDRAEVVELKYEVVKLRARLDEMVKGGATENGKVIEERIRLLDEERDFVLKWNDPAHIPGKKELARLKEIADQRGTLSENELYNLCISRGTLTDTERITIQNHVIVTKKMLSQLHFPKIFANVPEYAAGHHELLDGSGYPEGLSGDEIPMQARILAIADIFEALTAKRPYKEPMPVNAALNILHTMVNDGQLDGDIIQAAIDSGVFARYAEREDDVKET